MYRQRADLKLRIDFATNGRTIYNLVERGELSIIHIGRATRFAVEDLKAWIQKASEKCEDSENAA